MINSLFHVKFKVGYPTTDKYESLPLEKYNERGILIQPVNETVLRRCPIGDKITCRCGGRYSISRDTIYCDYCDFPHSCSQCYLVSYKKSFVNLIFKCLPDNNLHITWCDDKHIGSSFNGFSHEIKRFSNHLYSKSLVIYFKDFQQITAKIISISDPIFISQALCHNLNLPICLTKIIYQYF
jgi:hypothetical protein